MESSHDSNVTKRHTAKTGTHKSNPEISANISQSIRQNPSTWTSTQIEQMQENLGNQAVMRLMRQAFIQREVGGSNESEDPRFSQIQLLAARGDYQGILAKYDYNWFTAKDHLAYDKYVPTDDPRYAERYEDRLKIMRLLLKYRKSQVDALLKSTMEAILAQSYDRVTPPFQIKTMGGDVGYQLFVYNKPVITAFAPGSTSETSDYDITFNVANNAMQEVDAVALFNNKFREKFGYEAGVLFDTNVYTSGFMPEKDGDEVKYKDKFTGMDMGRYQEFKTHKHRMQMALSFLPILQYFSDKNPKAKYLPEWVKFQTQTSNDLEDYLKKEELPSDQALTDLHAIFMINEMLHSETQTERGETEQRLKEENPKLSSDHIAMMAGNELYQKQLERVKVLIKQRGELANKIDTTTNSDELVELHDALAENIIQFELEQGKALVYANEAYFSGGPAVHVVLGMQGGGAVKLGRQQQMQSLLMNIGYKLAHFAHQEEHGGQGRALVGTSKYGQRIRDIIKRGQDEKNPVYKEGVDPKLFSQLTEEQLQVLADEETLINDYKKNKNLSTPSSKESAAARDFSDTDTAKIEKTFLGIAQKILGPFYADKIRKREPNTPVW